MSNASNQSFALALTLQLMRGAVGLLAIAGAFWVLGAHIPAAAAIAVALFVLALVAWRGCPTCWLMGLFGVFGARTCPVPRNRGR